MLKPIGQRIVIRALTEKDSEGKTESGIFLPNSMNDAPDQQAIVVAVSEEVNNKKIKKDAKVLITCMTMREKFKQGDKEYEIVKETDILGIL